MYWIFWDIYLNWRFFCLFIVAVSEFCFGVNREFIHQIWILYKFFFVNDACEFDLQDPMSYLTKLIIFHFFLFVIFGVFTIVIFLETIDSFQLMPPASYRGVIYWQNWTKTKARLTFFRSSQHIWLLIVNNRVSPFFTR